jgi:hypothetical protein
MAEETKTFGLYAPTTTTEASADPPMMTVTAPEGDPASPPPAGVARDGDGETIDQRLARVEKDLARRDRELYGREERLRASEGQLSEWQDIKKRAAEDPLSAVRALGADPMLIAERLLGGNGEKPKPTATEEALLKRLEALEGQITQERGQRAQRDELGAIRNAIREGDRYSVLAALSEEGDAVLRDALGRAGAHYERHREVPNYGELLAQMEKEYTDRIFSSISRLNKLPSVQSKLIALLGDKTTPAEKDRVAQTGTSKTLTQATKQEPQVIDRKLTQSEKEDLALAYLRKSREET